MAHENRWDDTGLAKAMKFWPLVAAMMTFVFALGISSGSVKNLERRIEKESATNDRQEKQIAALEEATKEIVEIKRDIKELLRRVR